MKRKYKYTQPAPPRRPLKIYAFDPMIGRRQGGRITIDIPNETELKPGPKGERIEVIDYDGANDLFYSPIDLDDPAILMQDGLEPTESDPRFHQQMVYAVAMKVLENFDIALGRKIKFKFGALKILPHAFQGENAFYDPGMKMLCFGYFKADEKDPGPNIPGQNVFTCLSQDIIAHEMTHAIVDRLREYFKEPTNRDVAAFHEGFSDIIAIFQHFTFPAVLREHIRETRGDLRSPNNMIRLASEFGYATGMGTALRSALDPVKTEEGEIDTGKIPQPDPTFYKTLLEPHERGSILVAAVFDAFFTTYQARIADLVRIATGGTGKLPEGDLHPDLVNRIAGEASKTAQSVLNMCIRAFEYLPPVDVTFGDYLRALVTADFELQQSDEYGLRASMIEAFRARGIYPDGVASLAEESLLWESFEPGELPPLPIIDDVQADVAPDQADTEDKKEEKKSLSAYWLREILENAYEFSPLPMSEKRAEPWLKRPAADGSAPKNANEAVIHVLHGYATRNAAKLYLDPERKISVRGFHPVFRINQRGQLLVEMIAQFTQHIPDYDKDWAISGGLNYRGGTTVIAAANGDIRYVIAKPLPFVKKNGKRDKEALRRKERQEAFVRELDEVDTNLTWRDKSYMRTRIEKQLNFKAIHSTIGK